MKRRIRQLLVVWIVVGAHIADAWSSSVSKKKHATAITALQLHQSLDGLCSSKTSRISSTTHLQWSRRGVLHFFIQATASVAFVPFRPAVAYTPDPDKLRESLYLMSRVQEATVQQQHFVNNASTQEALKIKMTLTLRLVEKNYRLLDQINYASGFVPNADDLVTASEAGYEAADALQGTIDYVKNDLQSGPLADSQKEFLATSLQSCRDNLFVFLQYMPQDKLEVARKRVEEENVLNREEYGGDSDAGLYNPVVLPWKQQ